MRETMVKYRWEEMERIIGQRVSMSNAFQRRVPHLARLTDDRQEERNSVSSAEISPMSASPIIASQPDDSDGRF